MDYEILTALMVFAFVSSITPGPNNLMLMASGANYGFQRTIPHMLGIGIGFVLMVILVGLGLIQLFDVIPQSYKLLKFCSVAYLIYLAYKIASAGAPMATKVSQQKPFSFLQAALFQWVNPKAWTMALTAISVYSPSRSGETIVLVALVFGVINLPSVSVWTVLGQQFRVLLTTGARLRAFNYTMAGLLLGSLYPVVMSPGF